MNSMIRTRTILRAGGGNRSSSNFLRRARPPHNNNNIPPYIWISVGGTTVLIGYCYYAFLDEVPLTKRKRWIATSPAWERQLGDQEYRNLLQTFRRDILPPSHRATVTVHRVGARIAAASQQFAQQHHLVPAAAAAATVNDRNNNKPYTYTVVRSDMANAFVLPGNHVFVMTGLFRFIRDEDDLAAVLSHETAHNLARHAGEKISGSVILNIMARLSLIIDPSGLLLSFILPATTLLRELPHSRIQETEADQIGLHLAAEACYDPRAAKRVFAAMKEGMSSSGGGGGGKSPPEFLSTHPSHESRISNFDKWLPEAMKIFEGEYGDRCRKVREQMSMARQAAAKDARFREQVRQQRQR